MRLLPCISLLAFGFSGQAALAWEFIPGTPCVLRHETSDVAVELTYDPGLPLYTISLTQPHRFVPAPIFAMQFHGQQPLGISTGLHRLSNHDKTMTVIDRGFGNVLDGLQYNQSVTISLGTQIIEVPLLNAAKPVAAFRACDVSPTS